MKNREIRQWTQLKSQRKAVLAVADVKISNAWLADPTIFRTTKFITALKMRANVTGDRAALARA
jgi:hypothetical protein